MIWTNQGRMQLSEEALGMASMELNRFANQKQRFLIACAF